MKRLSNWIYQKSKGWVALCSLLAFTLFSVLVLPSQSLQAETYSGTTGSPDMSLFYSQETLLQMAETYGEAGRQAYVHARFTFDLVFPLVYAFFLTACISWLLNRSLAKGSPWRMLNLLPLGAMLLDFLENICAARVMASYPAPSPLAAAAAVIFTPVKWLLVGSSFTLLIISGLMSILKRKKE
jgi:hypothetical protein